MEKIRKNKVKILLALVIFSIIIFIMAYNNGKKVYKSGVKNKDIDIYKNKLM